MKTIMHNDTITDGIKKRYRITVSIDNRYARFIPRKVRTIVAWLTDKQFEELGGAFFALKAAGISIEVEQS